MKGAGLTVEHLLLRAGEAREAPRKSPRPPWSKAALSHLRHQRQISRMPPCSEVSQFVGPLLFHDLRDSRILMSTCLFSLLCLLLEGLSARRDPRSRFLKAENRVLRAHVPGGRVIPTPQERAQLLCIGAELGHRIDDLITIVQARTYHRWVREQAQAGRSGESAGHGRSPRIFARRSSVSLGRTSNGATGVSSASF